MNEVPLFPWWLTLSFAAWAAVGPMIGLVVGHYLTRSWQRQHWINDNVRQECRELLRTITKTFTILLKYYAPSGPVGGGPLDSGEIRERELAEEASLEIFYSMLFISDELDRLAIRNRWIAAIRQYEQGNDMKAFSKEFGTVAREIRDIARRVTS